MADATITTVEKVPVTLTALDVLGNATSPAAPVTWASADEAIATVTPSDDTLSSQVVSAGVGTTTVTVTDANGLSDTVNVTVDAAGAVSITAVVGTPEPK